MTPKIIIDDLEREMSESEIQSLNETREAHEAEQLKQHHELDVKNAAKTALLEKLGITEDEAKLLLG
jgi:hypothetical protein